MASVLPSDPPGRDSGGAGDDTLQIRLELPGTEGHRDAARLATVSGKARSHGFMSGAYALRSAASMAHRTRKGLEKGYPAQPPATRQSLRETRPLSYRPAPHCSALWQAWPGLLGGLADISCSTVEQQVFCPAATTDRTCS